MNRFKRSGWFKLGYSPKQVDTFFEVAQAAYESGDPKLNSTRVRRVAFSLVRHGYSPREIDAVLDRLERTYHIKERQEFIEAKGLQAWKDHIGSRIQRLIDRLERPLRQRFERERRTRRGYKPVDVDRMLERMLAYVRGRSELSADEVRSWVFRSAYGGYNQEHVDVYVDEVISVLLSLE